MIKYGYDKIISHLRILSATPSSQPAQLSRLACCCSVDLKLSSSLETVARSQPHTQLACSCNADSEDRGLRSEANLNIGEVNPVEVCQHLRNLLLVLQDCPGCLGKVIQTCVPPAIYIQSKTLLSCWFVSLTHLSVWAKLLTVASLILLISSGQSTMAAVSQDSRDLAKFLMAWVREGGMGRSTSGIRIWTRVW